MATYEKTTVYLARIIGGSRPSPGSKAVRSRSWFGRPSRNTRSGAHQQVRPKSIGIGRSGRGGISERAEELLQGMGEDR
jgi:hypothetical protein